MEDAQEVGRARGGGQDSNLLDARGYLLIADVDSIGYLDEKDEESLVNESRLLAERLHEVHVEVADRMVALVGSKEGIQVVERGVNLLALIKFEATPRDEVFQRMPYVEGQELAPSSSPKLPMFVSVHAPF